MSTAATQLAGVIGWPVEHSLSPRLHGTWLARYGIDGDYVRMAVPPEQLRAHLDALKNRTDCRFVGANLTVPHKEAGLALADEIEPLARRIGAVNILVVRADGSILGCNTDAFGFLEHLRRSAPGWIPGTGPAVVLGAGGAARAVVAALIDAGVPGITLVNRNIEKAHELFRSMAPPSNQVMRVVDWSQAADCLDGATLLVNTTTLGMVGQPPLILDLRALPHSAVVYDIVYAPLETDLLAAARARGNPAVDGLGMLLWQAVPGFKAWFGVHPTVDDALRETVLAGIR
jgi:shikimate dehydrogenase